MEPLHPSLRAELKRVYPGLTDEDIDRYEELTSLRFTLDPENSAEAIRQIDSQRTRLVRTAMPQFRDIANAVLARTRKVASRIKPAPRVEINLTGTSLPQLRSLRSGPHANLMREPQPPQQGGENFRPDEIQDTTNNPEYASITMAKKTSTPRSPEADDQSLVSETELPVGPTGRFLITMAPGSQRSLIKTLKDSAGLSAASTADTDDSKPNMESLGGADALLLEHLSVAVVSGNDADKIQSLEMAVADDTNPIVAVEPEEYVQAINDEGFLTSSGREYVRGYRDGVASWADRLLGISPEEGLGEIPIAAAFADTPQFTWGLQATRVHTSTATGAGLRVAVLDTGFFQPHSDFAGRQVIAATFVGQPVQDGHGHGTHCIGTALGDRMRAGGVRRYGCARQGVILVGKVLSNAGSGADGGILAGINWAIQNGARVISMSLGGAVGVGTPPTIAYENAGRAALNAGSLIIAAAGNGGNTPVSRPANSPSIMAVAAVDQNLRRAAFSCIGINPNGGEVNIAGPGVAVFSSARMPGRYAVFNGTSMATPHVAGIAALWSQRTGARGMALWQKLITTARPIGQPVQHVGRGLVQAPQ